MNRIEWIKTTKNENNNGSHMIFFIGSVVPVIIIGMQMNETALRSLKEEIIQKSYVVNDAQTGMEYKYEQRKKAEKLYS